MQERSSSTVEGEVWNKIKQLFSHSRDPKLDRGEKTWEKQLLSPVKCLKTAVAQVKQKLDYVHGIARLQKVWELAIP